MNIQLFLKECQSVFERFSTINNYVSLKDAFSRSLSNVVRWEYGTKSTLSSRGVYCPNIIESIVIGNVTVGKATKVPSKKTYYTFGFDRYDNLIIVDTPNSIIREIIQIDGKIQTGITFIVTDIFCVTITEYDDRNLIKSYTQYEFSQNKISLCDKYVYSIIKDKVVVDFYRFYNMSSPNLEVIHYFLSLKKDDGGINRNNLILDKFTEFEKIE